MRYILPLLLLTALPGAAQAGPERQTGPERLTVVELFTSQGCSSCPPADALLAELSRSDPAVLALGFHITYWDRLGWKDPYSLPEATARRQATKARFGLDYIYTPQLVVDGRQQAVGSDRAEVRRALAKARAAAGAPIPLTLATDGALVHVQAGAGPGKGALLLVGYDPEHVTPVRAGENGGRTLREVNIVRGLVTAAAWTGGALDLRAARPPGERVAAVLQGEDGAVLGVALLP